MPYATTYIPATDKARFTAIRQQEKQGRVNHYNEALKLFRADADDYTVNLVKLCADRTVQFLFNDVPRVKSNTQRFDNIVNKFFEGLGLGFFTKLSLRGFLMGNTYLRVTQGDEGLQFTLVNPSQVIHYTNDNDEILWYEITTIRDTHYYIEDCVKTPNGWVVFTYKSATPVNRDLFNEPVQSLMLGTSYTLDSEVTYPSGIVPLIAITHLPAPDGVYGRHEVDQKRLLKDINELLAQIATISELNSTPLDVIVGADIADVKEGADILTIANPAASIKRLEMQSNLKPLMDTLAEKIKLYLAVARVVLLSGELQDLQRVTNMGIKILFSDVISKNKILKDSYEKGLHEIIKTVALVSGYRVPEYTLVFAEPLPVDYTELAAMNTSLHSIGARSLRTIMHSMGDDPNIEFYNLEKETIDINGIIGDKGVSNDV